MRKFIIPGLLVVALLASCGNSEVKKNKALCECVDNEAFRESHYLSKECIGLCIDKFGESLSGMEKWFMDNCGAYSPPEKYAPSPNPHPSKPATEKEEDEGIWM
ncbi:MAG: hypothetical protein ACXITV_02360 [Luteibaculaceae bacterium]